MVTLKTYLIWYTTFISTFFLGLWAMDVSVTTMNVGGILTNGFVYASPSIIYHIGVCVVILSMIAIAFLNFEFAETVNKKEKCERKFDR